MKAMRTVARTIAVLMLFVAAVLGLLGVLAWPPGGLMFALPYFFFFAAGICAFLGAVLLLLTRNRSGQDGPS